jgi:hypothetical protein
VPHPIALNERHLRILQILADAEVPTPSRELGRRTGLLPNELRSACSRLRTQHYIDRNLKRIRQQIGDSSATKLLAFWWLTEKGRACLSGQTPELEVG